MECKLNMKTVLIKHETKEDAHGNVSFTGAKSIVQGIKAFYSDGSVRTISGDVWKVKPCQTDQADFEALPEAI